MALAFCISACSAIAGLDGITESACAQTGAFEASIDGVYEMSCWNVDDLTISTGACP